MMSHSIYPQIDPSMRPAIFSSAIINTYLRKKIKFRGLIITDDLQMEASKMLLRPEEAALEALKAGNDMVMLTWSFSDQKKAVKRVLSAVRSGELSEQELNKKLGRILKIKGYLQDSTFLLTKQTEVSKKKIHSDVNLKKLNDYILDKNLLSNAPLLLKKTKNQCVVSSSAEFLHSFDSARLSNTLASIQIFRNTKVRDLENRLKKLNCDRIVFTVSGKKTAALLYSLNTKLKKKALVINLSLPGYTTIDGGFEKTILLSFAYENAGGKVAQLLQRLGPQTSQNSEPIAPAL
jgi:beta-N-acetylhexosaminidase